MTRRRRQILAGVAAGVLAVGVGIVAINLAGAPGAAQVAPAEGEMPTALSRHLEKLRQSIPGNSGMSEEGPASAADAAFAERAYPADTISIAQMDRAKSAFTVASNRPFPVDKATEGRVEQHRAESGALSVHRVPELVQLRAERLRRRRPDHLDRHQPYLPAAQLPRLDHARGRRCLADDERPRGEPEVVLPRRPAGHQRRRRGHRRPQRPAAATPSTSAPARRTSAAPAASPASASTSRPTAGPPGPGRLGKDELAGKGIGEIVIKPGDPNTLYVGTTTALRGMSSVCCTGVTRPVPDAAKWGLYKSTNGGTDLVIHPQRLGRRRRVHRQR